MSIASARIPYEDEKQRELECREAMKDQFLDSSAYDLAIRGWQAF